jgi:hypothetical protein
MNSKCGSASAVKFATIDMYRSISKCVNPWRITSHRHFLMVIVTSLVVFSVLHHKANKDLQLRSVFSMLMPLTTQQIFVDCGSPERLLPLVSLLVRGTRLTVFPLYYRQYQYLG